ncbi:MAG TPA: protein translocase subunit SecD [Actinomycetota bacterium]|nr:protein translocase subunit SecD [Actinomycetota bacterium]
MRATRRHVVSVIFVLTLAGAAVAGFVTGGLGLQLGLDLVGGVSVILTAPQGTPSPVIDRALETVRERVDRVGVAEPDITRQGQLNIQVQIPGAGGRSQQRLLELIGRTARLEFREVLETITPASENYQETEITPGDPEDEEVVFAAADVPKGQEPTLFRMGPVLLTGDTLSEARSDFVDPVSVSPGDQPGWRVAFQFNAEGSDRFGRITTRLAGDTGNETDNKQMAIILDRRVESAPTVNEAITGGQGVITGDFTEQEARDLGVVLQTGALPVELAQSEVETVSATLGREALRQGLVAGIVGLVLLALYLAFYYRLLGVVTWLGMAVWAIFALAIVALLGRWVGYSLTLAGVAGLVVSLGVTADSYIVFYERLKDEVRRGKTVRAAVGSAFNRAWRTIVAADIVTITAAVILYILAIGSVRGFALTLGIATLLDMFVVYVFKRPTVFLIAGSRFLSELRGMGLRSGVAVGQPEPVRGASR